MKKKIIPFLLIGSMILSSVAGIQAEELLSDDSSYTTETTADDAPLLLPEETESPTEDPEEELLLTEETLPETGASADLLADGPTATDSETVFSASAEAAASPEWTDVGSAVSKAGGIRPSNSEPPSTASTLVGVTGTFYRSDAAQVLSMINRYRKEACDNHYPDPRDPSRKLTSSDYHPVTWSRALESVAQTRAAEASYTLNHLRPNGESIWTCQYPGANFWMENLAWNNSGMIKGVQQWYDEKEAWVSQNQNEVTGHYEALINPAVESLAIGCYLPDDDVSGYGWYTVSGAFGSEDSSVTAAAPVEGKVTQMMQVRTGSITTKITNFSGVLESGKTAQPKLTGSAAFLCSQNSYYRVPCQFPQGVRWSVSTKATASIDPNTGSIKAKSEGVTAVYAYVGSQKAVTKLTVIQRPKLINAYNSTKGLGVQFQKCPEADSYIIYRMFHGVWEQIAEVKASSSSLTVSGDKLMYYDTTVKNNYGNGYIYSVAAKKGKTVTSYDRKGVAIYRLQAPTLSRVTAAGNGKVNVTWSKVPAMGYEVQFQEAGSSVWHKCPQTAQTSQTISGLTKGKSYRIRVRCFKSNPARGTYYSSYSKLVSVTVK